MKRILVLILFLASPVLAKNIDLSTLPSRDTVQLTIYNAEDLTLVRETRRVTFKQGANALQFSWANTLIDPTSVEVKFLSDPDKLTVLDTTFPHDKPQMLYWNVASEIAGEATVEISYFTSGITWSADYVAFTSPDETAMNLEGYVTVTNRSGEDYEDAQVRLVVGTINLVEQIAQLAQGAFADGDQRMNELRSRVMRKAVGRAEAAAAPMAMDMVVAEESKAIVKEGLSEYFIFTIEGTETVPNQWSKRMLSFEALDAPMKVEYRYRPREYGHQLVRMFLLTNDEETGMGESPLPDGVVRIFKQKGERGLGYVAQQHIKYIPIGDKIELNVGVDPNVVFELRPMRVFRNNIWGTFGNKVRRQFDAPGIRIEDRGRVEGWDEHTVYEQVVRNYTGRPIHLEVRRSFGGDITFISELGAANHDYQTVKYEADVSAGDTARLVYEVLQKQGTNTKQNRVQIKHALPSPPVVN